MGRHLPPWVTLIHPRAVSPQTKSPAAFERTPSMPAGPETPYPKGHSILCRMGFGVAHLIDRSSAALGNGRCTFGGRR